ncbi:hypothetical protein FB451DRAFT_1065048 [Mycena latifolia]|nr:hypothetical protein FB451DRAFT_1065048 [Mycena latifolia]
MRGKEGHSLTPYYPFHVLSSAKAAGDFLDKRSAIYSDRPTFVMSGELVGRNISVFLSHYGERLRTYRRLLHTQLGPQSTESHLIVQIEAVDQFILGIIEHPQQVLPRIRASVYFSLLLLHAATDLALPA